VRDRHLLCLTSTNADVEWVRGLTALGWVVSSTRDVSGAHRLAQNESVLVGVIAPGRLDDDGWRGLDAFLRAHGRLEWVGVFEPASLQLAACRDLVVNHLFDHHTAPVNFDGFAQTLGHAHGHAALRRASQQDIAVDRDSRLIGDSPATLALLRQIRRLGRVDAPVLICGESGCGKEVAAQAIHRHSSRSDGPFVAVNCGAIQPSLIQSELFGHTKGAFTGADRDGRGLIEAASGGTIFLDEIGDLPLELQTNLLRFLQEKTINRVGSTRSISVDARVIAATHVDLERAVAEGRFREDLFYRLNVVPLSVPALRERLADVEQLALHFFEKFAAEKSPQLRGFSRDAIAAMGAHPWRGNVRELINRVRRAMVMAEGRLIGPVDLGLEQAVDPASWGDLDDARKRAERGAVALSLQQAGHNVTEAAKQLGVSRMTLYRLMAKHGLGSDLRN
jgi:DNA-binding NtrC family response regulator